MATLSQLLALPHLGLKLIQSGPGDPEITWGSITELLQLSDYLEGGELIMTTGLQLGPNAAAWNDFVAGLSRARIAAIGFGVGINHDRVPEALVRAASTYRVALFEIPLPVPFIAVSKAIAGLLRADELRAAHQALRAQRRILDGARGEQDPAEVLASIAQATGRQLALVSMSDPSRPLASTAGFAQSTHTDTEFVPLNTDGTMHLAVAGNEPLTPEGTSVIAAGAMVLGLGLRNDRASERTERERWALLTDHVLRDKLPFSAAQILSPGLPTPELVRVLAVQGSAEDIGAWRREPRRGFDRCISRTEELSGGLARAWQLVDANSPEPAVERAVFRGLDVVVSRAASPDRILLCVRSAESRLRDLPGVASLYVEPRRPHIIWADRDAPFLEAMLALGTGRGIDSDPSNRGGLAELGRSVLGQLSRTSDTLEHNALRVSSAASHKTAEGESVVAEQVSVTDRELLRETLLAVFTSDGQRGPAATSLGIHRNTLRDRISRIERITGRTLSSAADRAELWFALCTEDLSLR